MTEGNEAGVLDTPERIRALAEHMRRSAKNASEVARMMAQSKSLRQGHNPPRDDLYMWPEPEQTIEWEVAAILDAIAMEAASAGETEGLDGNRDSAGLKGIAPNPVR